MRLNLGVIYHRDDSGDVKIVNGEFVPVRFPVGQPPRVRLTYVKGGKVVPDHLYRVVSHGGWTDGDETCQSWRITYDKGAINGQYWCEAWFERDPAPEAERYIYLRPERISSQQKDSSPPTNPRKGQDVELWSVDEFNVRRAKDAAADQLAASAAADGAAAAAAPGGSTAAAESRVVATAATTSGAFCDEIAQPDSPRSSHLPPSCVAGERISPDPRNEAGSAVTVSSKPASGTYLTLDELFDEGGLHVQDSEGNGVRDLASQGLCNDAHRETSSHKSFQDGMPNQGLADVSHGIDFSCLGDLKPDEIEQLKNYRDHPASRALLALGQ